MASRLSIRSNTSAGIIFRTVFVVAAWLASLWALDWGIYLFTPAFEKIYVRSENLIVVVGTALLLTVIWAVILLPEKRPWADVGWTRGQVSSSLLLGGLLGSSVYLVYVGVIIVCGWYSVTGHYGWSNIPTAFLISLLNALALETLYQGYVQRSLEQRQGSGLALIIAAVMYGSEPLIGNLLQAALNKHYILTFGPREAQGVILHSAFGFLYGAAYLWNRKLWTAVGVHWGCRGMDNLLTYSGSHAQISSVFRYTVVPHSFDFTGIGFITKVTIFIIAGVLMAYLAKRRGHWQERGAAKSQP